MLGALFVAASLALPPGQGTTAVTIVQPDATAAVRVEIVGATEAERAGALESLARLGSRGPVRRVVFSRHRSGRSVTAFVRKSPSDPTGGFEGEWLGQLFLRDVAATLRTDGIPIVWTDLRGDDVGGQPVTIAPPRRRSETQLRDVTAAIDTRGRAQHQRVSTLTAYSLGSGGVKVVITLSRSEFLRGRKARWLDVVPDRLESAWPYWAYVVVVGPGGIPVSYGANFGSSAGTFAFGPTNRALTDDLPRLEGAVSLRVRIERSFPRTRRFTYAFECAQRSARCETFRRDWTLLLPPTVSGVVCGGVLGIDAITIGGTVDGVPIRRHYSNCYGPTVGRWEQLLSVPTSRR